MRMRRTLTALISAVTLVLTGGLLAALATPAHADEWLYVLSSEDVRVIPGKGESGRVVLRADLDATQFTDRPDRLSSDATVRSILSDFDWDRATGRLSGKVPNAAVAIDGDSTQVVEIRRATVASNKVTLFVRSLDGPLSKERGSGAVFIDAASGTLTTAVSADVLADSDYNPQGPTISVTFSSKGITLWSGTLTPASPSASVPTSSAGSVSISGTVSAEFSDSGAQVTFTGQTDNGGSAVPVGGLTLGSWSS